MIVIMGRVSSGEGIALDDPEGLEDFVALGVIAVVSGLERFR